MELNFGNVDLARLLGNQGQFGGTGALRVGDRRPGAWRAVGRLLAGFATLQLERERQVALNINLNLEEIEGERGNLRARAIARARATS